MYLLPYHHNKKLFSSNHEPCDIKCTDEPLLKTNTEKFAKNAKFLGRRFTENEMEVYVSLVKTKFLTRNMYLILVIRYNLYGLIQNKFT